MRKSASPPSVSIRSGERSLCRIFILLALSAAGMAALLSLLPPAGHDQLWFLLMARRWLQGAQIYGPQIFDSNPPGIVWLSAVPVLLGRALHLPTTLIAKSLVVFAEIAVCLLSFSFLRRARPVQLAPGSPGRSYEIPALLFAAIVLFCVVPARDFGQRDQILSFLVLPYVLAAAVNFRQHRLAISRSAAGVLAAIGICLKPHHALIPIAVELALLLTPTFIAGSAHLETADRELEPDSSRLRSGRNSLSSPAPPDPSRLHQLFRPEPVLILLLGLAYLLAIRRWTPLYFTLVLPILRDTYWAIGHLSLASLAFEGIELCVLAIATILLFILRKPRSRASLLLLVAASAATLVYFVQGTGWYYQQLPAIVLFGAALAIQLLDFLYKRRAASAALTAVEPTPDHRLIATIASLCILALALTTYFTGSPFTLNRAYAPVFSDPAVPDPVFFASFPPGTSVAILTTSVEGAMMPIQRFDLVWAQRTDNLWLLPAILRSESHTPEATPRRILPPSRLAALDAMQHRWMVEDLTRWRPTLILVARCQDPGVQCQELEDRHLQGRPDNLLAWFLRDPAFALVWSHYAYAGSHGAFDAYTLRPALAHMTHAPASDTAH